jgi:uncharacterized protein (TIGR00251 family)
MRVAVRVIPRSSKNEIIPLEDNSFKVKLTAAPVDGKGNESLIKLLSEYFNISKSRIRIVKGEKGRKKIVEIN